MRVTPTVRACLFQYAAVVPGLAWGWALHSRWDLPADLRFIQVARLSIALLCTGAVLPLFQAGQRKIRVIIVCVVTLVYESFLILRDPFQLAPWTPDDGSDIAIGIFFICPILFAMAYLARLNGWWGAIGAALFVDTGLAMMIRNGMEVSSGVGFHSGWRS